MSIKDLRDQAAVERARVGEADRTIREKNVQIVKEHHSRAAVEITEFLARHHDDIGLPTVPPPKVRVTDLGAFADLKIGYKFQDLMISVYGVLTWDEKATDHRRSHGPTSLTVEVRSLRNPEPVSVRADGALDVATGGFAADGATKFAEAFDSAVKQIDA